MLCGAKPSRGLQYLERFGLLKHVLPELKASMGVTQNRYHKFDVFFHSIYTCDAVRKPNFVMRAAGLFHDLGKVATRKVKENGEASFHNHEYVSARIAGTILQRLDFSHHEIKRIKFLVRNHMFHYTAEWSDRAVKRFLKRIDFGFLEDLITLRMADREGSGKRSELPGAIKAMIRHIDEVHRQENELKIKDISIDGHTLMKMGIRPGPIMGYILNELLRLVRDEDFTNEPEPLIEEAKKIAKTYTDQKSKDSPEFVGC